jgi:hypothetical protein
MQRKIIHKGKTMNHDSNSTAMPSLGKNNDEMSLSKLHSMACVLMTKFHYHQCPKLAQFIVRHLHLLLEQPEIKNDVNSRTLYLQLLEQWQKITAALLEQTQQKDAPKTIIH